MYSYIASPFFAPIVIGGFALCVYKARYAKPQRCKGDNRVVIMTKYPVPGRSKTRLIPSLGDNGAASVQLSMTNHIVDRLSSGELFPHTDIHLHYCLGSEAEMKHWYGNHPRFGTNISLSEQTGIDLGDRILNAFLQSFTDGRKNIVVIGADIPGITVNLIKEAFESLRTKDMVLGKAKDGGYYLVGLNHRKKDILDKLFKNINWGTEKVFEQQKSNGIKLGISVEVLSETLEDVDYPEDLPVFEKEVGLSVEELTRPKVSIIMPTLNEVNNIEATVRHIQESCKSCKNLELVVADGGSTDGTLEKLKEIQTQSRIEIQVVDSEKGRGPQQNNGAKAATGDIFIFLHADTLLPVDFDETVKKCLAVPGNVGGAFKFGLDVCHNPEIRTRYNWFFLLEMKLLQTGTNWRAKYKELPYGDQALFMKKQTFKDVKGFKKWKLFEDFNMVEKLRKIGHIGIAPGPPCITSARRWQKHGFLKVTGYNQLMILGYKCNISPDTLAEWYYGKSKKND